MKALSILFLAIAGLLPMGLARAETLEAANRAFAEPGRRVPIMVQASIDQDVPAPIITLSLQARFRSRQDESYGAKILAALRNQFGGHAVKKS